MADSSGPLSGTSLGRYRVGPLLGRGGMGEVYRAEDVELHRAVALKVLPAELVGDADRLARFVQEARTASALNHPHVVSIYEIGEAHVSGPAGRPVHYIAMELVQGETLRAAIDRRRLDLKRTLEHFTQAAEALAAAHAAGIIHRDLKPDNLMIADGGYVKVLDFGLAKLRAERSIAAAGDGATVTATAGTTPGVVMGTVGYMSPEQAQGLPVDQRSDIFSFGCMLYEAIGGSRPFSGSSAVDTLHRIIHDQPPPVSGPSLPFEVQRIVRKCLAKSPDERYQSIREVAIDLRNVRRDLESGSTAAVAAPAPARPGARRLWIAAAAVAALGLIAGGVALWKRGSPEPAAQPPLSIERITASGNVIDAIISPDGKYIAYVESSAGRQTLLFRQVSGTRPIELGTSLGFWGIAFSPDATSLYYAVKSGETPAGILYALPVLGGTPRELLTGIDSAVTFSPDASRIAYFRIERSEPAATSLVIAGADGRDPRPLVTKRRPEYFVPAFFTAPSWSPDGRRIAAALRNAGTRDAALVTFDVADGAEHSLSDRYSEATFTRWLADGSGVLFVARTFGAMGTGNGGQLWLQPYPSGDARRVTNDVIEYRNVSVTADGRSLLSVGFEASTSLSILSLATGELQRLRSERTDGATGIAWDGSRVFFVRTLPKQLQIWTMGADGENPREVVANVRPGLALSPDGRTLAFLAERDRSIQLWRADANGANARPIAAVDDANWLTFSRDGRTVLFSSAKDGPPSTYRVSIEGGEPQLVARGLDRAALSPDGSMLAGLYRSGATAPLAIGVVSVADGTPIKTFPGVTPGTAGGGTAWTPDGSAVLYLTSERMNLWKQSLDGGPPQKITNFADLAIVRFAMAPDGRSVLLCRGSLLRDAFLLTNF